MATVEALMAARQDAIARGDKALGREIYHQIQAMGVDAEVIDRGETPPDRPGPEEPAVEPEPETAEPDSEPVVETATPPEPETAVLPKARVKKPKDSTP